MLSDFRDASGRTMQERLDLLGDTPRSYLARLTFREAFDRRCQDSVTLAFTYLESREVFVCGTQFWQAYQRNSSYVEALIIHEMMHTLGLGENPPSSLEISARGTETLLVMGRGSKHADRFHLTIWLAAALIGGLPDGF